MQIKGTAYTDPEEMKYRLMARLIEQYKVKYPKDWDACMQLIKAKRAVHRTKYGEDTQGARREIAEIPVYLNNLLERIDPDYDKGSKGREFYRRFPVFLSVEKI